jgi:hypothetical protein
MTMANRSYAPEEQEYADRLFNLVLTAVIDMEGDGTGVGGYVRPHVIRNVLAEVAATVDHNCQTAKTPRDSRRMGEEMGGRYTKLLRQLDADPAMRAWTPATVVPERAAAN